MDLGEPMAMETQSTPFFLKTSITLPEMNGTPARESVATNLPTSMFIALLFQLAGTLEEVSGNQYL